MAFKKPTNVWFRPAMWHWWARWPRLLWAMRRVAKTYNAAAADLAKSLATAQSPIDEGISLRRWGELWDLHQHKNETTEDFRARLLDHIRGEYKTRSACE